MRATSAGPPRNDAISMIGRLSVIVERWSFETLKERVQNASPFIPVGAAREMTLVAVDLEVSRIDSRSLQFRHHLARETRRKQFVGARHHVENLRTNPPEVLLSVVMRARLRQRNQRIRIEALRPRFGEL